MKKSTGIVLGVLGGAAVVGTVIAVAGKSSASGGDPGIPGETYTSSLVVSNYENPVYSGYWNLITANINLNTSWTTVTGNYTITLRLKKGDVIGKTSNFMVLKNTTSEANLYVTDGNGIDLPAGNYSIEFKTSRTDWKASGYSLEIR